MPSLITGFCIIAAYIIYTISHNSKEIYANPNVALLIFSIILFLGGIITAIIGSLKVNKSIKYKDLDTLKESIQKQEEQVQPYLKKIDEYYPNTSIDLDSLERECTSAKELCLNHFSEQVLENILTEYFS